MNINFFMKCYLSDEIHKWEKTAMTSSNFNGGEEWVNTLTEIVSTVCIIYNVG